MNAPPHESFNPPGLAIADESHGLCEIHRQFAARLLALAKRRLGRYLQARLDPEDIVQSAFLALFQYMRKHVRGPRSACHLKRLLWRFVVREIHRAADHHRAQKRSIYRDHGAAAVLAHVAAAPAGIDATALADTLDALYRRVGRIEREIVRLMLQGHQIADVAGKTRCSRWTVRRALNRVGHVLRTTDF